MKVVLINPAFDTVNKFGEISMQYNKKVQPTDLAYVAALLRVKGYDVKIIDANIDQIPSNSPMWKSMEADVAVITTASLNNWQCPFYPLTSPQMIVKALNSKTRVIVMGPHGTSNPEYIIEKFGEHVIVVRGEPEKTILDVIEAWRKNKPIDNIPGIDYIKNGKLVHKPDAPMFDIDFLPIPAYDLLPMKKYRYEILGGNFALMEASRGCPYKCTFCLKNMYRDVYKNRNPKKVVEEIKYLQRNFGVKNIFFIDLEFTIRKWDTIRLCKEIVNSGIKINYAIQARADKVDDETLYWLKESGCKIIQFGVESGDHEILKSTNKMITLDKIEDGIKRTRKFGIKTLCYFLIGHPKENHEDVLRTIEFAKQLNPDYASFLILIPYPGTANWKKPGDARLMYPIASERLSMDELEALRKRAIREFYLRPQYVLNKIRSVRDFDDVKVLFNGFMDLFVPLIRGA